MTQKGKRSILNSGDVGLLIIMKKIINHDIFFLLWISPGLTTLSPDGKR